MLGCDNDVRGGDDITIEILKGIRDEIRGTNQRIDTTNQRLDTTIQRLDVTNERLDITIQRLDVTIERLDVVETTLLDVVAQQRFASRYLRAIAERDHALEPRVSDLELRVTKLESD